MHKLSFQHDVKSYCFVNVLHRRGSVKSVTNFASRKVIEMTLYSGQATNIFGVKYRFIKSRDYSPR